MHEHEVRGLQIERDVATSSTIRNGIRCNLKRPTLIITQRPGRRSAIGRGRRVLWPPAEGSSTVMRLRRSSVSFAVTMFTISPSTSWAGPSRSTFATKADALCRDVQRKVGGAGTPTTRAELIAYLRKEQRVTTPALAKLESFALPTKHHSEANRVVRLTAGDLKALGHYIDALKAGGTGKRYSDTLDENSKTENKLWKTIGALDCVG